MYSCVNLCVIATRACMRGRALVRMSHALAHSHMIAYVRQNRRIDARSHMYAFTLGCESMRIVTCTCKYVCMLEWLHACMYVCLRVGVCVSLRVRLSVCSHLWVCMRAWNYVASSGGGTCVYTTVCARMDVRACALLCVPVPRHAIDVRSVCARTGVRVHMSGPADVYMSASKGGR